MVQEVDIPIDKAAEFLRFFLDEVGIRRLWMCLIGGHDTSRNFPFYPLHGSSLFPVEHIHTARHVQMEQQRIERPLIVKSDPHQRWKVVGERLVTRHADRIAPRIAEFLHSDAVRRVNGHRDVVFQALVAVARVANELIGPGNPGNCYGEILCDAPSPPCPSGTTPGIENGCFTGQCIPLNACETTMNCPDIQAEATCIARFDCTPLYKGADCTCDSQGSNCVCNELKFEGCSL